MFSLVQLLIIPLLVMSDREHFWNTDKIAQHTESSWDALQMQPCMDFKALKNKKILLIVHGFNNSPKEAMETYHTVAGFISLLRDAKGRALYDAVVGYLWPGYDDKLEYFAAKKHAQELKEKMRDHLLFLASISKELDIMAHSMGNRLVFEALNFPPQKSKKKVIQKFYSLAAAVNSESIEENHPYAFVTTNCEEVFIFHSKQDEVLKVLYKMAEWNVALGFEGIENLKKLPKNVQLVDCTQFVKGHSMYFNAAQVYEFILGELLKKTPAITAAPSLKILDNGGIEILAKR